MERRKPKVEKTIGRINGITKRRNSGRTKGRKTEEADDLMKEKQSRRRSKGRKCGKLDERRNDGTEYWMNGKTER